MLGNRDYEILRDLFHSKVCDLEYIHQKYFQGCHLTAARKRLDKLFGGDFLKKIGLFEQRSRKIAYSITPKGLKEIESILLDIPGRRECLSSNLLHDLELTHIKGKLEKSKLVTEIRTENELQSYEVYACDEIYGPFRRLNSDLFVTLASEKKTHRVAIEYERSAKAKDRWEKYLLDYHLENKIDAALYICHNKEIKTALEKVESQLAESYSAKIYFCELQAFQGDSSYAKFTNYYGEGFVIHFH